MRAPLTVVAFTPEVAAEAAAIAQALPYRADVGVDPERVVWVVVPGHERIGIAWAPDHQDGACWMIAMATATGTRVVRSRVREVVELVAGRGARFQLAPVVEDGPPMTMARVPVSLTRVPG